MIRPTFKLGQVLLHKRRLGAAMKRASYGPLARIGAMIEREAKVSMAKGGRRKGKKTGVPSRPGTPPHVQEGTLRASVAYAIDMARGTVVVGPTEWYGKVHEYGGRRHPKRPFMWPAANKVKTKMPREFRGLKLRMR